ncbi:MAG: Holliday junction resolvase RuvX [Candidatus Cloacimonetes bacterium]|nr:Holliday junction resolvase RuvX [Candidatus Cloacimonadota bacterium]
MTPQRRVLAVDYGSKRIGLAISDPLRIFAKPLKVIPNQGFDAILTELGNLIAENDIELLICGIPYAIEGGDTPKTTETKAFMARLAEALEIPVLPWDERYSTDEAEKELIRLGYDWKQRRPIQDAMAAAMILKSYLDSL